MANPNEVGALYAFCFAAFFMGPWSKVTKLASFLPVAGIYLSGSKAGAVCLLTAGAVWLVLSGRKLFIGAGVATVIAMTTALIFAPIESLVFRATTIALTFPTLMKHWVMGAGLGHWKALFIGTMPTDNLRWDFAHNEFYQAWAEMGIAAVLLIGWYFVDAVRRYNREAIVPFIALVIVATNSLCHFGWHIAPTAIIGLTWMAIYEIKSTRKLQH